MIRKFAIAAAAVAALGAASLTPAFAGKGGGGGWGHHHGHLRGGLGFGLYVADSCYRDVIVINRRGERVLQTINVCD